MTLRSLWFYITRPKYRAHIKAQQQEVQSYVRMYEALKKIPTEGGRTLRMTRDEYDAIKELAKKSPFLGSKD